MRELSLVPSFSVFTLVRINDTLPSDKRKLALLTLTCSYILSAWYAYTLRCTSLYERLENMPFLLLEARSAKAFMRILAAKFSSKAFTNHDDWLI